MNKYQTIDEYIQMFEPEVQNKLNEIRCIVLDTAPEAKEAIKYQMPTFVLKKNLIFFAAFKDHIGLYPMPRVIEVFKNELTGYKTSKGTIQIPLDKPLPMDLIKRIVEFRVKEINGK